MSLLLAAVTLISYVPSSTAAAPVAAADEVVVEGRATSIKELKENAHSMIRMMAVMPWSDRYARWNKPVCPEVIGTSNQQVADIMKDKVRSVAAEAGIPIGKPGCESNIVIAFTDDAGKLFSKVASRRPRIFEFVQPPEARALRQARLPVRWWYSMATGGSQGALMAAGDVPALGRQLPALDYGAPTTMVYGAGSLIGSPVSSEVLSAAILIDVPLVEGSRLNALAAHVALVALAPTRMPPQPVPVRSIGNLYQGSPDVADLTEWDRAYLRSLYATLPNRPTFFHRAAIVGAMMKEMKLDD